MSEYKMFAAILTGKPWDKVTDPALDSLVSDYSEGASKDRVHVQKFMDDHAQEIADVLAGVPREVLMLLKTNDCLRSLYSRLGVHPADTFIVMARACTKTLNEARGLGVKVRLISLFLHFFIFFPPFFGLKKKNPYFRRGWHRRGKLSQWSFASSPSTTSCPLLSGWTPWPSLC